MRKLIKSWEELSQLGESPTHVIEVDLDMCCGWLTAKNPKPYNPKLSYMRQVSHLDHYLSTHTFYGTQYKASGKILRACGFDVDIDNWDKE